MVVLAGMEARAGGKALQVGGEGDVESLCAGDMRWLDSLTLCNEGEGARCRNTMQHERCSSADRTQH